jgi:hypothetical protein
MTQTVERRSVEDPADDLRDPFPRVQGIMQPSRPAVKPANSGLTRRERKVKDLLLRELGKRKGLTTLSYAEIQNLEKTLNVVWIDGQIASMRKQYKGLPWLWPFYGLIMAVQAYNLVVDAFSGGHPVMVGFALVLATVMLGAGVAAPIYYRRSLRRKIFIYEALRELAGADEAGVTLSEAVEQADDLIARIVDMELAAEAEKPAKTIGRVRSS